MANMVRRPHSRAGLSRGIACGGHQVWRRQPVPGFAEGYPVLAKELDAPLHEMVIPVPG